MTISSDSENMEGRLEREMGAFTIDCGLTLASIIHMLWSLLLVGVSVDRLSSLATGARICGGWTRAGPGSIAAQP